MSETEDPVKMDREDHKNLLGRIKAENRKRGSIAEGVRNYKGMRARKVSENIWIPGKVLHVSSNLALGDMVRQAIVNREAAEYYRSQEKCTVLVKDGKLTPEGVARGIKL